MFIQDISKAIKQQLPSYQQSAIQSIIVQGYKFDWVCRINPETSDDGGIHKLYPQSRYVNKRNLALNQYGEGPFCRFRIPKNFRRSGVYAILVDDVLQYIGECVNLSGRYNVGYGNISPRNCFKGGQETNCRINNQIFQSSSQSKRIDLYFMNTDDFKAIEKILRKKNPPWNRA